jgi:predicted nucleic acid-binding protein
VTSNVRVVRDTNVVVSAALLPRSTQRQAFDRVPEHGALLMSSATVAALAALNDVLRRPRFDPYVPQDERLIPSTLLLVAGPPAGGETACIP